MTKGTPRAAKVTQEHREEAARLKEIWLREKRPTQEHFGATYGIGSQGAVWRFLNAKDPLSLKAARGFAEGLKVDISEFSPRLAHEAAAYAQHVADKGMTLTQLSQPELQLVLIYRELPPEQRDALLTRANTLYSEARPGPFQGDNSANNRRNPAEPPGLVRKKPAERNKRRRA
jgi:hypothetical protein